MKKDGIQTRNRKVSNKNKKSKKAALLEPYSEVNQPPSLDDNGGHFSLGPGTLLTYSHAPHLMPTPSPLHASASLPYTHHLNSGMVPTLVWRNRVGTCGYSDMSLLPSIASYLCEFVHTCFVFVCFFHRLSYEWSFSFWSLFEARLKFWHALTPRQGNSSSCKYKHKSDLPYLCDNPSFIILKTKVCFSFVLHGSVMYLHDSYYHIKTPKGKEMCDLFCLTHEGFCFKSFEFSAQWPNHSKACCVRLLYSPALV